MKKNITKELADAAGYINLVAGGTSMPRVSWLKRSQQYTLTVSVPGVNPEQFSIDILDQTLLIFQQFEGYDMPIPNLIHKVEIPFDVDVDEISASRSDRKLTVSLPFNEMAGGYQRHVDIEPEY
jgi:HSP20 family molecular chaperone IbpA